MTTETTDMIDMHVVIDCTTGQTTLLPPTAEEAADVAAVQREAADRATAEAARVADREAALDDLQAKATTNPDLAVVARALGLPVAQPDTQPV